MSSTTFAGFGPGDFQAYEEHKWASNRFNLERMRAREKLEALASAAAPLVAELGLERESTHDHPTIFNGKRVDAQWVFFARPQADRRRLGVLIDKAHPLHRVVEDPAPHHLHAILSLRLFREGLEISVRVHRNAWVDLRNLAARCADAAARQELAALLAALDRGDVSIGDAEKPAPEVDATTIEAAAASLAGEPTRDWVRVSVRMGVDEAGGPPEQVAQAVSDVVGQLVPIYQFVAWTEQNDHLALVDRLAAERQRAEQERLASQPRPVGEDDQVRILKGLLAGHTGRVESLDGMGGAKVRLGTMTVQVMVRDLQPEG